MLDSTTYTARGENKFVRCVVGGEWRVVSGEWWVLGVGCWVVSERVVSGEW